MEFEDIIVRLGGYGKYQKRLILLFLVPLCAFAPWFGTSTIFMVSTPDHWCHVPELANFSTNAQQRLIRPSIMKQGIRSFDSCSMFDVNYSDVALTGHLPNNGNNLTTKPCDMGCTFDKTYYDENAVTHSHYPSLILSLETAGSLIGTPIFSYLSDRMGRKKTLFLVVLVYLLSTMSPAILKDLNSFIGFRVVNGMTSSAIFQLPFVLIMEMVGPGQRTSINAMACLTWALGLSVLPLVVYVTRSWVYFNMVSTATGILFLIMCTMTPESPRWLMSKGMTSEAVRVLRQIALVNGATFTGDLLLHLKDVGAKIQKEQRNAENVTLEFIRRPRLRLFLVLITFAWIGNSMAYYGLTLHAMNLHGNEFVNFFLMAIIEIPAYLLGWYLVETRLGRRWSHMICITFAGLCLCVPAFLDPRLTTVTTVLTICGKFGATISAMIIIQQATELYPTPLRNLGLGLGSTFAAVACIFLPQITFLSRFGMWIPMFIIGVVCFAAGIEATFLPETHNTNLPQTCEDAELFGADRPYWSFSRAKSALPDILSRI